MPPSKASKSTAVSEDKRSTGSGRVTREINAKLKLNGVPLATIQLKQLSAPYAYTLIRENLPLCSIGRNKTVKFVLGSLRHIESLAKGLPKVINELLSRGLYDDAAYILDSLAALVDEFANWDGRLETSNVEFVSAILQHFSFAHVVRWQIQAGNTVAYMYGAIDHLEPAETKLFVNVWVKTPDGDFMERLVIGDKRSSESLQIDYKYFHRANQKAACSSWSICRWSEVEQEVNEDLSKIKSKDSFRLRLKEDSGVFDTAPQIMGTRQGSNRLSGIWADSFISMSGDLLVESGGTPRTERLKNKDSLYKAAERLSSLCDFTVAPYVPKSMAVSVISQDSCERYYAHLSCVDVVRSSKRPDIVVRGDVMYWGNQAVNMHNKSTVRLLVLAGPPGFGKTKLAEMFAADLAKNFLRVSVGVVGLDLVQLASRLAVISRLAETLDACVIIDDADFLLSARVDDTYRYGLFQAVIEFIDRSRVPIICTTNLAELDEAIVLRADHGIWVDWDAYLNEDERKQPGTHVDRLKGENDVLASMLRMVLDSEHKELDVNPLSVIESLRSINTEMFQLSPREVIKVFERALRMGSKGAEIKQGVGAGVDKVSMQLAEAIHMWSHRWCKFRKSINKNARGDK